MTERVIGAAIHGDSSEATERPALPESRKFLAPETVDVSNRADWCLGMDTADLREALDTLGEVLASRGQEYDLVLIGGGALHLLGLIQRPTRDLDIVSGIEAGRWIEGEPVPPPPCEGDSGSRERTQSR